MSDSVAFDEFNASNLVSARISESTNKTSGEENTKNAVQYQLILIAKKFDNESDWNKKKIDKNNKTDSEFDYDLSVI